MNVSWLITITITIILGSLAISGINILARTIIAIFLILIVIICFLLNALHQEKNKEKKVKVKNEENLLNIQDQIKKTLQNFSELGEKIKNKLDEKGVIVEDIDAFFTEQDKASQDLNTLFDESDFNEINIDVHSRVELINFLSNIEPGTSVTFYDDSERDATIKRYSNQELWEFLYYRKGFRTTITDFSLQGVIDNEYFDNAISWIERR